MITAPKAVLLSVLLLAYLAGPEGRAQESEPGPVAAGTLEEVVVTARKKEESLLDAPLSITALGAAEIESADLSNISDIADATPGFHIDAFQFLPGRFDSVPFIRGVVIEDDNPTQQTVSVFMDGVYVAGGTKGLGVEDIERVEVIKGPQSALFGRTTFSGAINYITADPADEFRGRVSTTVATRDEYEGIVSVEGPIGGDHLTARLTGRFSSNGGHYNNTAVPGQKLGEEETWSVGATVVYDPGTNFYLKVRGMYYEDDDGPAASFTFNRSFNNFGPLMNVFVDENGNPVGDGVSAFRGQLPAVDLSAIGVNSGPEDVNRFLAALAANPAPFLGITVADTGFGLNREAGRLSVQSTIGLSDNVDLDILAGYAVDKVLLVSDFDNQPLNAAAAYNGREFEDTSLELRLSGDTLEDRLNWAFGVNYFHLDFTDISRFFLPLVGPNGFLLLSGLPNSTIIDNYSAFGRVEYAVTDRLGISLEGRYQTDEIDLESNGVRVAGSPASFDKFLPRVTVDFEPTADTLLYATYSVGNLPGGFNPQVIALNDTQRAALAQSEPGVGDTYDEEELVNYEFGWKQSLGSSLNFALSAFYMDRKDQQVTTLVRLADPTTPTGFLAINASQNAQTSEIKGFEFEGNWSPLDILTLKGTLAYSDATIQSFPENGDAGEFEDIFGNQLSPSGQTAPVYPEWQGSLSATFSDDLDVEWFDSAAAVWYVRGDVFYRGEYFTGTSNLGTAPESTVVNLRAGVDSETLRLEAFVTNLTDEDAYTAASTVRDASDFRTEANLVGLRDKRQVGLRATYRF